MKTVRLLLIEEDAQDYLRIRQTLDEQSQFEVDWAPNYESALKLIRKTNYDAYLISYYAHQTEQQSFLARLYPLTTVPMVFLTKNQEQINTSFSGKGSCLSKEQLTIPLLQETLQQFSKVNVLQEELTLFQCIFDNTLSWIGLLNSQGYFIKINQTALTFLGISHTDLVAQPLWESPWLFNLSLAPISSKALKLVFEKTFNNHLAEGQFEVLNDNGQAVSFLFSLKPVFSSHGELEWVLFEAHPDQKPELRSEKSPSIIPPPQLLPVEVSTEQGVLYDELTGLPNRRLFVERLERAMAQVRSSQDYHIAVLFIDLDRFKVINASLGHDMGDWLLMEIGQRLRDCLQTDTLLARSGGDEFLVLLENLQDLSEVTQLARKINEELIRPFSLDGYEIITSASIGVAYSTHQGGHVDLLRNADTAMYRAKAMGKSCYVVFSAEMYHQALSRLQIEADLHKALENKHFLLFYQPQTELTSDELVGAEALIRFNHPRDGLMLPNDFISVLEDTGLIITLGEWILQTACQQFKLWLDDGLPLNHIAVNLSAHQFRSHRLPEIVADSLSNWNLAPQSLELEITETLLLEDIQNAVKMLRRFKDMGIRVTIDDFGTGYASLNYLKRFPADGLKIDKSFIQGIIHSPKDAAITVATIDMAHALGMTVVAEGVETDEQREFLRDHGCDWAQGYLYAPPMEKSTFQRWSHQYDRMIQNKLRKTD